MTILYQDPFGPPWRFNWLRMLLQWEGGIIQCIWIECIVATLLCVILITIVRDVTKGQTFGSAYDAFDDMLSYLTARFQAALSLMLGFYTSILFSRWWAVRSVEGGVMGGIATASIRVTTTIRDEQYVTEEKESDNSATEIRMHLIRWLNLAHAIAVGEVYEKKPNEFSSLEKLRDCGLATDQEYDFLQQLPQPLRFTAPLLWFTDRQVELRDKELCRIDSVTLEAFEQIVCNIRSGLATLYMYKATPVPLSYRQLVNYTVRGYMCIVLLRAAGSDLDSADTGVTNATYWKVLPFFFEYFLFIGWLNLSDALGNPFRVWADEFKWENYVRSIAMGTFLIESDFRKGTMPLKDTEKSTKEVHQKLTKYFKVQPSAPPVEKWHDVRKAATGF